MALKMKQEFPDYYAAVTVAVQQADTPARRERYLAGDFPRSETVKDLDVRYRWDLYWVIWQEVRSRFDIPVGALSDEHIDSALRSIVPPLRAAVAA